MNTFNEVKKQYLGKLEQYVPIVERVHGESHPEFYDVRKVFDELLTKIKQAPSEKPDLAHEFKQLRNITSNYSIPEDVCESYTAVYEMLAKIDKAYHS